LGLPLVRRPALVEEQARKRRVGVVAAIALRAVLLGAAIVSEGDTFGYVGLNVAFVGRVFGVVKD
jgi:hypothetical protein